MGSVAVRGPTQVTNEEFARRRAEVEAEALHESGAFSPLPRLITFTCCMQHHGCKLYQELRRRTRTCS